MTDMRTRTEIMEFILKEEKYLNSENNPLSHVVWEERYAVVHGLKWVIGLEKYPLMNYNEKDYRQRRGKK